MKLQLTLEMDNDAFNDGNNGRSETARILRELAARLKTLPRDEGGKLRDINGNTAGKWSVVAVR